MVNPAKIQKITSLTRSGTRDWLVQRMSALVLVAYTLFIVGYLMLNNPIEYTNWRALFDNIFVQIFTFLALLSIFYHTWVGMWTIYTDYIKFKSLRLTLQVLTILVLWGYLVWGIIIIW